MTGLFHLRSLAEIRRLTYSLLLAGGLAVLFMLMIRDLRVPMLAAQAVPVSAGTPAASLKPLTAGPYMDGFASWSPSGRQVAFMRDGRIWVVDSEGKQARALTRQASGWDAAPAWRPDGKQIAFIRLDPNGRAGKVMLLDPAGGKESTLISERYPIGYLAWAPDGSSLYYTTEQDLMRVDLKGLKQHTVFATLAGWEMLSGGLAISPDGRTAIFGAGPRDAHGVMYDLWSLSLAAKGSEPERITTGGAIMPAIDATGRYLAYRSPRQATGVYVMSLGGGGTQKMMPDSQQAMYFHPAFSPDGKTLSMSGLRLDEGRSKGEPARLISHIYLLAVQPAAR